MELKLLCCHYTMQYKYAPWQAISLTTHPGTLFVATPTQIATQV